MSVEFGSNGVDYLTILKKYKEKGFLEQKSPYWWSTDYGPDPREYLPFEQFQKRLVCLGKIPTRKRQDPAFIFMPRGDRDINKTYVYQGDHVPITVLDLEIDGDPLRFLVTARPYSPKEQSSRYTCVWQIADFPSIPKLQSFLAQGGTINLLNHFYPHIRGLLASQRGNHYFWYELSSDWRIAYKEPLELALKKKGIPSLDIFFSSYSSDRTYLGVWEELKEKPGFVGQRKTWRPDFPFKEVSAEEFIQDYQQENQDLAVYYPLKIEGFNETLPLFVATRICQESQERKPIVLGIYAGNGLSGFGRRAGILRILNREFAKKISALISQDFNLQVDTLLFIPKPGKQLYERISGYPR